MTLKVAATAAVLLLSAAACRTVHDINYNQAHGAADSGNDAEAFRKFKAVSEADGYDGQASAQYLLAEMYLEGKGAPRDVTRALELLERAGRSDDKGWRKLANFKLGHLHERGIPGALEPNRVRAADFYKRGSDDGYDAAVEALAHLRRYPEVLVHFNGSEFAHQSQTSAPAGIASGFQRFKEGDKESARQIFLWHARNGNDEAQAAIAAMYKGEATGSRAHSFYPAWTWLAAKNGNIKSQFELGLLYRRGEIVPGSDVEAAFWFQKAADQGYAEAVNWLGLIAAHPLDRKRQANWTKAVTLFRRAANGGSVFAMVNLADALYEGHGVSADRATAISLYKQAAEAGNVTARRKLIELDVATDAAAKPRSRPEQTASATSTSNVAQPAAAPRLPKPEPLTPVELYTRTSPSVFKLVAVKASAEDASQGSAVALTDTVAITNCHVLDGKTAFGAKLGGQIRLFARSSSNPKSDLCAITSQTKLSAVAAVRSFADLKVGEKVYAIGSPQSLENTISEGIISGLRTNDGVKLIQTTAPITYGSSGGGLFDEQGRLIGVTSFGREGGGNLNFAVSIDEAVGLVARLR